jgi:hypothetical protein
MSRLSCQLSRTPTYSARATAVLALSQQYGLIVNGGANLESARGEGESITPASGVNSRGNLEARVGIEPTHKGFADLSLTAWVPRHLV